MIREVILEHIQPYLVTIVVGIIGLVVWSFRALLQIIKAKLDVWLDAKLSVEQRRLLHQITKEAYAHAESVYRGEDGQKKLLQALTYASSRLNNLGVSMSTEEIKAAIHEAWLSHQPEPPRLD